MDNELCVLYRKTSCWELQMIPKCTLIIWTYFSKIALLCSVGAFTVNLTFPLQLKYRTSQKTDEVGRVTSDHPTATDEDFTGNPESTENLPTQNVSSFFGNGGAWGGPKEEFTQKKIAFYLQKYGDGFILIVGTVGNIAALVILLKKKFRSNVFNNYLIAFTIADIVFVVFDQGLAHWNEAVSDFVFKEHSDFTCKLWTYITKGSYSYANWVLAGINLNRAFAIIFPLKMKTLASRRNNYMYLFISLVVIAVFEVYEIIGYEIIENYSFGYVRRVCGYVQNPSPSLRYFNDKVVGWLYFVTSTLAPGLIILFCNGFIISTLLRRKTREDPSLSVGPTLTTHRSRASSLPWSLSAPHSLSCRLHSSMSHLNSSFMAHTTGSLKWLQKKQLFPC